MNTNLRARKRNAEGIRERLSCVHAAGKKQARRDQVAVAENVLVKPLLIQLSLENLNVPLSRSPSQYLKNKFFGEKTKDCKPGYQYRRVNQIVGFMPESGLALLRFPPDVYNIASIAHSYEGTLTHAVRTFAKQYSKS